MNILYVITDSDGGGAQRYVLDLARRFRGAVASGGDGPLLGAARAAGLKTFTVKNLKRAIDPVSDAFAVRELAGIIRAEKPDLVHANSSKAGGVAALACRLTKTPNVYTAHGFVFNEPLPAPVLGFYRFVERFASRFRDRIIAVSEADRMSALQNRICSEERITVVHNGIAPTPFFSRDQARELLGVPAGQLAAVTVANFYQTKGLDVLLAATAELPPAFRERLHWYVIGDGPLRNPLHEQIARARLHQVHLLGSYTEAARFLHGFDLFVLPSRKEGFPYALLEALAAGLPIVATDVGGCREAIGDAGVLVPPENPGELAAAVAELAADESRRKKLAAAALERSKQFTLERMAGETEAVYRQVLAARAEPNAEPE